MIPIVFALILMLSSSEGFIIKGHIVPEEGSFGNFSLDGLVTHIRIEDVTFQDMPSKLLNEKKMLHNSSHLFPIDFDINYNVPNETTRDNILTLRASIKSRNETLVFLTTSSFILNDESTSFNKPFKLTVQYVGNPCKLKKHYLNSIFFFKS